MRTKKQPLSFSNPITSKTLELGDAIRVHTFAAVPVCEGNFLADGFVFPKLWTKFSIQDWLDGETARFGCKSFTRSSSLTHLNFYCSKTKEKHHQFRRDTTISTQSIKSCGCGWRCYVALKKHQREDRWVVTSSKFTHTGHLPMFVGRMTKRQKRELKEGKQSGVPLRAMLAQLRALGVCVTREQAGEILKQGTNTNLTDIQMVLDAFSCSPSDVAVVRIKVKRRDGVGGKEGFQQRAIRSKKRKTASQPQLQGPCAAVS
jgi:hypothetical protein